MRPKKWVCFIDVQQRAHCYEFGALEEVVVKGWPILPANKPDPGSNGSRGCRKVMQHIPDSVHVGPRRRIPPSLPLSANEFHFIPTFLSVALSTSAALVVPPSPPPPGGFASLLLSAVAPISLIFHWVGNFTSVGHILGFGN